MEITQNHKKVVEDAFFSNFDSMVETIQHIPGKSMELEFLHIPSKSMQLEFLPRIDL